MDFIWRFSSNFCVLKRESTRKQLEYPLSNFNQDISQESQAENPQITPQQILLEQPHQIYVSKEEILKQIAQERNQEIQGLRNSLQEVLKLASCTSRLLAAQNAGLQNVEQAVAMTEEETEKAVQTLGKAAKENSESWRLTAQLMFGFVSDMNDEKNTIKSFW